MRERSISAIGIALIGVVPAIMGGPVWAVVLTLLCAVGYSEYQNMAARISPTLRPFGYLVLPLFAIAAWYDGSGPTIAGIVAVALGLPFLETILRKDLQGAFLDWSLTTAGTLYLGIPIYCGILLRQMSGGISTNWLNDLADKAALDWDSFPRGLAWLMTVILVTWMADTFAYLGGRTFGKHPLSPVVSPKKTVEGFAAALIAGAITGVVAIELFGLDVHWASGIFVGLILTMTGLLGDLAESVLKRQAGIKDSGNLIPGHGGMLDRLDAILFNLVVGLYLAMMVDKYLL